MSKTTEHKNQPSKAIIILGTVLLVALAVSVGWVLGHRNTPATTTSTTSNATRTASSTPSAAVSALVSYTLPGGWAEASCTATAGVTYIVPAGTTADCATSQPTPIQIAVDSGNTTDCRQLQPTNNAGIRDHTCLSLYIDGHKSLKALTEYSTASSYKVDTTFSDYFIDTGHGVVKAEYTYTSDSSLRDSFEQLAKSVRVKS